MVRIWESVELPGSMSEQSVGGNIPFETPLPDSIKRYRKPHGAFSGTISVTG